MGLVDAHTAPKYGTKPIQYVMLHFWDQSGKASLQPSLFENRSPVWHDFCGGANPIHYSENIEGLMVPGH